MTQKLSSILAQMATMPDFINCQPLEPRSRGLLGDTPLHIASIWGDQDAVVTLLDAGAEIDAQGEHGYTPLHEAVEQGHRSVVKALLARGASPDIRNDNGLTPRQLAEVKGNAEHARLFEEPH
jgi:uncharacterized protein